MSLTIHSEKSVDTESQIVDECLEMFHCLPVHLAATLHRATLNRATVKRRQFTGRQLTGATIITAATDNRVPFHRATLHRAVSFDLAVNP